MNGTPGAVAIGGSMPVGQYLQVYPAALQYGEQGGAVYRISSISAIGGKLEGGTPALVLQR